jgi:hypothetical protein
MRCFKAIQPDVARSDVLEAVLQPTLQLFGLLFHRHFSRLPLECGASRLIAV